MYKEKNGNWKSDFIIKGTRYQRRWYTRSKIKALSLEKEYKSQLKKTDVEGTLSQRSPTELKDENNIVELLHKILFKLDEVFPSYSPVHLTFKDAEVILYEYKWSKYKDTINFENRWKYISKYFGKNKDIAELTTNDILDYFIYLKNKGYANKTINHYISNLKTGIEFLVKKNKVSFKEPISFDGLRLPINEKRIICFTKEEEKMMYTTFKNRYLETKTQSDLEMLHYFVVNSNLGLRPSEYFSLVLGDIDFKNKQVTISKGKHGSTKNEVIRTLPIGEKALRSFYDLCIIRLLDKGLISNKKQINIDELSIIINSTNIIQQYKITSLTDTMIGDRWNRMKKTLNWIDKNIYKQYIPYGLRHTVASRLAGEKGFNPHQIMKFMGHKNIATSLNYVHLNIKDIRGGTDIGFDGDTYN